MPRMTSRAPASTVEEANTPPWALPILRGPRYSQSLERGLAILGCFTSERPVLGIADIADELGMSRSTTHRYVTTLLALGYLEQGRSRKYRLGLRVTDLGMSALNATGLRENVHPFLEELRERTGYTIGLAVLDGAEILYVDRARSWRRAERETDLGLYPGSRMPSYCTAMGKVMLAHLPEEVQRDLLAAAQARAQHSDHDHKQTVSAGGARADPRRWLCPQRPGAAPRPTGDRGARARRVTRGGRRDRNRHQPGSHLAARADRGARSASTLHCRPHLFAPGLPTRRRALGSRNRQPARTTDALTSPGWA